MEDIFNRHSAFGRKALLLIRVGLIFYFFSAITTGKTFAGIITIQIRMTHSFASDRIKVRIDATNRGTESAQNLRAFLYIFNRTLTSEVLDRLKKEETHSFDFEIPKPDDKRGRFAFTGEVLFHDANNHPFSALACNTFNIRYNPSPQFTGHIPHLTVKEKGKLRIQVINLTPGNRTSRVLLRLPHGLISPVNPKSLKLGPYGKSEVNFQIENRYGIGAATYPFFCILEDKSGKVHYAEILRSTIQVKEFKNWFHQTKWYWLAGIVPIILCWIVVLSFRRKTQ